MVERTLLEVIYAIAQNSSRRYGYALVFACGRRIWYIFMGCINPSQMDNLFTLFFG